MDQRGGDRRIQHDEEAAPREDEADKGHGLPEGRPHQQPQTQPRPSAQHLHPGGRDGGQELGSTSTRSGVPGGGWEPELQEDLGGPEKGGKSEEETAKGERE